MMRNKTSSSMQKTYDDCYLICSTAVYFEGQVSVRRSLSRILNHRYKLITCDP